MGRADNRRSLKMKRKKNRRKKKNRLRRLVEQKQQARGAKQ